MKNSETFDIPDTVINVPAFRIGDCTVSVRSDVECDLGTYKSLGDVLLKPELIQGGDGVMAKVR